jgi:hypothetical protein
MSTQFNNTTSKAGLIQLCEDNCGFSDGDISGNPTLFAKFTGYMNLGLDDAWSVILQATGKWHLDDSNFTDYPFITTNLVSGQRDYSFTTDGSGNVILDIYRVMVADPSGVFHEIHPVDQQATTYETGNSEDTTSFFDGKNASGTPTRYSKTGNGIFLDVIPSYNSTGGLKIFINREASYFTTAHTTKMPGFAGLFHTYLSIFASEMYCGMHDLKQLKKLNLDKVSMRRAIEEYYAKRDKDTPKRMIFNVENNK